ncbi:Nonribosomal peptide synthetase 2 [Grifola frondosa]|uniref:Nonribosomal peptide synthetase 2 n=1 Tax=Grifola frondosa TaxID=5627 RepID=A0A1C7MG48_GRIFR|nr:Nonribosomal peptide synthetase 2 [Grifola frondosa]
MESARAFWSMYLSNFNWQTMLGRTASSRSADVMTIPFQLSLSDLQLKAARQQVTLQALLMCAFGSLLGNVLYGQDDVVFGVVRSGRSLPVDDIATTICPTITVVPARINFRGSSNILRTVQEDISRVGGFEHIPLGRIQHWVTEGDKSLFETLFSLSFKEHDESVLWRVLESQNPEPDYILAVEVVLDPILDNLVVQAAYTSADISSKVVSRILRRFRSRCSADGRCADHKATEALAVGDSETQEEVFVDEELVAQICSIASKFLQIDLTFVKADASLFALGLDSIKSIGLSRKLHVEGITITSADIMRLATPLRLSGFVRQNGRVPRKRDGDQLSKAAFAKECSSLEQALGSDNLRLSEDDQIKVFPTSVLQAGMLSQTVGSAGRRYVHLFPLRLRKSCDIAKLRQAWENATNRAQVVHSVPDVKWFNGLYPEDGNLQLLLRHFTDSTDVGDEVFKRPPIYLHLLTDSASRGSLLVLVMHHALYDGISVAKLFDAVLGFYEGHDAVSPVQYHDLLPALMWQEREGLSFWIKCLQDLHNLPIPRKPSGIPAIPSSYHASLVVPVEEGKLKRICGYAAVTLQCIAQSAFAKLLATATGSRDVLFGRVVSGRDLPSAEAVIGPILNTIPCRVRFDDNMSNELLLRTVHEANVAAIPWHHASLRSIQHRLGVSDLWDSIFVFQPLLEAFQSESEPLWEFDTMEEADISIHYPLNLEVHEQSNGFLIEAACAVEVMGIEELQSLLARYAGLLHHIIDHPDQVWSSDLPDIPSTNGLSVVQLDDLSDSNDEPIQKDWDSRSLPIRDILSSVTGVDVSKIHLRSHLAALGIDSITAVQIVAKARRAGIRLNASDIVQSRTVDSVLAKARFFEAAKQNGDANQVVIDIPRDQWPAILARFGDNVEGKIEAVTVASPGMQWLIGMWQRSKGSRFQHVFGFRLPGNVEAVRLRSAWEKLLLRHAILRSTFISDNGIPRVVIFKPEGLGTTWMQEDLDTSTNVDIVIQRRMKDLVSFPPSAQEPFTKGVLLSSSEHSCLLVYLHHFQYDAWSLQILVDDLYRLYEGKELVSSNDLQSFLRFSTPHVQARAEQRKYWKTAFPSSYSRVLFPSLRNASTCAPDQRRIVYTLHDAVLGISHLDERARALSVSLQNVFLACWAKVQAAYTSSDLSVFGLWHSGRSGELKDIDRLVNTPMDIAKQVQEDLRNRTALIEQSDLVEVDEWVGGNGQPLCNVFVNIVKIAPDVEKSSYSMFEVIDAPYFIPEVPSDACSEIDDLKVTALTQDDVMIDMVILKDSDKAAMSIEASANVMDIEQAKELVSRWATLVKESLV